MLRFAVLGPLEVHREGDVVRLGGPRHRAVLARLLIAAPRVVPVQWLIDDLWDDPPPGALGSVQTFVGALRKALEPERPPRTPSHLLITQAPGYALRPAEVDAWQFADEVREGERRLAEGYPLQAHDLLERALGRWRGPAYAEFVGAQVEARRLAELRSLAVERRAEAGLALGRSVVPGLEEHVAQYPLREGGWRLLALALYRDGRQADALATLRRARATLAEQAGVDPGEPLQRLEADILAQAPHLSPERPSGGGGLWRAAITARDPVARSPAGRRERLEALMGLVRALALTGELAQARQYRAEAVRAAAELADPLVFAQVVGAFEVPAIWTANDDEELSAFLVEAAERALVGLSALAGDHRHERARLLITIALERRADEGTRGIEAAVRAEGLARELGDPYLLALALNGRFLQTFSRAGLAPERAAIGRQLLDIAAAQPSDRGLPAVALLGHLILVQAGAARADLISADRHAAAADELAEQHGIPLVGVFTAWYAALRTAIVGPTDQAKDAYRTAAARLPGTGMPGVENGLLPLALLGLDLSAGGDGKRFSAEDFGPYQPWVDALLGVGPAVGGSPHDLLFEARTALQALVALRDGDEAAMRRAYAQLLPAADELAGAGSGMVTLGPVAVYLGRLAEALGETDRAAEHFVKADQVLRRTVPRP